MRKVFVVGGSGSIENMFSSRGYELTRNPFEADIFQFTGGADISPELYGQKPHKFTHANINRDVSELGFFQMGLKLGKIMLGICRGGQLMNVMCGGSMWQHVENHTGGKHSIQDFDTGKTIKVTSVHHQMMIPAEHAQIVAASWDISPTRESDTHTITPMSGDIEPEVILYPDEKVLCFQGHPEFDMGGSTEDYYFDLIQRYFAETDHAN